MDFIVYGIRYKNKKGAFCQRSIAPYYFISYFRTDYMIELDGRLVRGRAGDMFIGKPNDIVYHGPTPDLDEGFVNDWIYVGGDDFSALLERYPLPTGKPFAVDSAFYLSSAIEKIHREKSFRTVGAEEKCNLAMTEAVIDVFRAYSRGERVSAAEKLEMVRGEMMRNVRKSWCLSELAAMAGYSESRFSALYKEHYGISPINDLIDRRIEEAKLLILYGNMPLGEIADATGFSGIYHFSKQFKQKCGISPAKFREKGTTAP